MFVCPIFSLQLSAFFITILQSVRFLDYKLSASFTTIVRFLDYKVSAFFTTIVRFFHYNCALFRLQMFVVFALFITMFVVVRIFHYNEMAQLGNSADIVMNSDNTKLATNSSGPKSVGNSSQPNCTLCLTLGNGPIRKYITLVKAIGKYM
ncbi:uncharacterized protein LACBIDRAFT_332772 [Laccaria bicolor S238N-H82]|uniref:Predicted protein n=1 Tax=Laccaria bicolor (strain S238N-H82 / ATCC MYA-4686) TaxID=486041 RepID=B0DU11_LACBS|nr:uncharacterized protein LACBIDRAFT_332772 [Laccaria bicolor S238N-H82]EDR02005.1 predicted protein [Laccaria bicolor S238N-H82]|eukprot:XP_001887396.1 predicted protein [Laccaria bicolor S238N-H82]